MHYRTLVCKKVLAPHTRDSCERYINNFRGTSRMNFSSSLPVGSSDPSITKEKSVVMIAGDHWVLELRGSPLILDIFQKWRFFSSLPLGTYLVHSHVHRGWSLCFISHLPGHQPDRLGGSRASLIFSHITDTQTDLFRCYFVPLSCLGSCGLPICAGT